MASASPIAKVFKEADGTEREFAFGKMNAVDAVKVYYPLLRVLPPLFKAVGALAARRTVAAGAAGAPPAPADPAAVLEVLTASGEDEQLAIMIDGLVTKLSSDELVTMMRTVFKSVVVRRPGGEGGQVVDMDVHFNTGLSKTMLLVFAEGLKVNFSDFFGAARSGSPPGGPPPA
jgi:hypothetical protein